MNCEKVGKLIQSLRKEQRLTQQQLADKMHLSDRTISKWERGLGCPDISLLHELSNIFGVNIEKILAGELEPNDTDGGNMKRIKFYVCPTCGNILTATGDAELSCCGRKLSALVAQPCDEKHHMNIETVENDYYITFAHEMHKEHYISFVAHVRSDRVLILKLYPEQSPEVRFPKLYGGKLYFYCSQDGLWVNA